MKKTYNKHYISLLEKVIENGKSNEGMNVRAKFADGSPAYSTSIFGELLEYDTSEKNIPFLTLRSIPYKTAVREMLAFWVNQVFDEQSFKELGMYSFWKEWIMEDGTIGKWYAYNHESRHYNKWQHVDTEAVVSGLQRLSGEEVEQHITEGNPHSVRNISDDQKEWLRKQWYNMTHQVVTGKRFVDSLDLLNFEHFLRIVRRCPQFFLAKEANFKGWVFTIDYYCTDVYSEKTIVFIEDVTYYSMMNTTIADKSAVIRPKLSKNQVVELLKGLQNDKASKRHMVNFFNWANQDEKALVECCYSWHFTTTGNKLNMLLTQRSADIFLGLTSNSYQFYVLLRILANDAGLEVGEYKHMIVDAHLYSNQIEASKELIKDFYLEKPYPTPKLVINYQKDFFDYTIDDFSVVGKLNDKKYKIEVAQ